MKINTEGFLDRVNAAGNKNRGDSGNRNNKLSISNNERKSLSFLSKVEKVKQRD